MALFSNLICLILIFFLNSLVHCRRPYGWPFEAEPSETVNFPPIENPLYSEKDGITDEIINKFSPLIYLHSEEAFFPSGVDIFLENVNIDNEFMTTKEPLLCESCSNPAFLKGSNPADFPNETPVYALVVKKDFNITDVFYFYFYPFNKGKKVCVGLFIDSIGCVGTYSVFGNHVGDWEHVTIRFINGRPVEVYYSAHGYGTPVPWSEVKGHREFMNHPVAYVAEGSHGCYANKGNYVYQKLPTGDSLVDRSDDGILWQTWKNIKILRVSEDRRCCFDKTGRYLSEIIIKQRNPVFEYDSFNWIDYNGKWGNRKGTTCLFGQCVLGEGPIGPFRKGWLFNSQIN